MIKKILAALLLTFPIYALTGSSDLVTWWFVWGNGWAFFEPLLKVLQYYGFSGRAPLIYAVMLVISFLLSLLLVFGLSALIDKKYGKTSR